LTNPDYRHLEIISDRSFSMLGVAAATSEGIAAYIAGQRALPGKCTVSLTEFDTAHDQVFFFRDIDGDTSYTLKARGGTALLDAIGFTFTRCGEHLAAMDEKDRPGEVTVLIATDGEENSSHTFSLEQVQAMIARQQEAYGWTVVYMGANQDAFQVGASLGVPQATTLNYCAAATAGTYASASAMVARGTMTGNYTFNAAERTAAVTPDSLGIATPADTATTGPGGILSGASK